MASAGCQTELKSPRVNRHSADTSATMMTFDTGTWGAVQDSSESAREKRRREKAEREAELARIKEEEEREAARKEEEQRRKEQQWAKEAAGEKENQQAGRRERAAAKRTQQARAKASAAQTEAEKIEAALAECAGRAGRSNAMQRAARETLGGNKREEAAAAPLQVQAWQSISWQVLIRTPWSSPRQPGYRRSGDDCGGQVQRRKSPGGMHAH